MSETYTIHLPYSIPVTKKKKFYINLNQYRNTHYFTLNKAKTEFSLLVQDQISKLPKFSQVSLEYKVFPPTARDLDIMNICSVADKFFCDALVEYGILEDDNYHIVNSITNTFGSIDKHNPRIEVKISGKIKDMKIIIDNQELQNIIQQHISNQVIIPEGKETRLSFTDEGVVISIVSTNAPAQAETKPAPKAEPKENTDELDFKPARKPLASNPEDYKDIDHLGIKSDASQEPKKKTPSLLNTTPASALAAQDKQVEETKDGNVTTKPLDIFGAKKETQEPEMSSGQVGGASEAEEPKETVKSGIFSFSGSN